MLFRAALTSAIVLGSSPVAGGQTQLDTNDFMVNCVSTVDQSSVTLVRSGGSAKGYIMAGELQGEADILPGLGNLTFLLIQDSQVVNFSVDLLSLDYNMMIRGATQRFDKGSCTPS
jgi:hypothetical protein